MAIVTNTKDTGPRWLSGVELARMIPQKREYLIDELLPAIGVVLVTADAKAGKSTLALECCRAVCTGTRALDTFTAQPGAALYWMADDGSEGRFIRNYQEVFDGAGLPNFQAGIFRLPLSEGGNEELIAALHRTKARLVVIDCLTSIRGVQNDKDFVRREYDELRILADLSSAHKCCIVVLHHRATAKRGSPDNPFRQTAGSYSLNAAVDGLLTIGLYSITRSERIVTLAGRDMDSSTFLYARDRDRKLFFVGGAQWVECWDDALRVYRHLQARTVDGSAVAEALGIADRNGRARLARWRAAGIVEDIGSRRHAWSDAFVSVAERLQ